MLVATNALREQNDSLKGALPGGGLEGSVQEGKDARLARDLTLSKRLVVLLPAHRNPAAVVDCG